MITNQMHWRFSKLIFLALVTVGTASVVSNTTMSANGSATNLPTVVPTPSPTTSIGEIREISNNDVKCAQRSLVGPNYNRLLIPPDEEGSMSQAVIVRVILDILRIMDVSEQEEIIVLLLTLKQFWTDSRIKPSPEYIDECPKIKRQSNDSVRYLPEEASKTIWFPDVYLYRVEEVHISKVLVNSAAVRINSNGDVEYTMFGKFTLSCDMNFRNFPLDIQYCPMYIESYRIRFEDIQLIWDQTHPMGLLRDYSIDQFSFSVKLFRSSNVTYDTGTFSRIGFVMIFSRKLPFYMLQIYLPTVLFVIISWLTFFIPPPYAQGRIILTTTTLLALTALNSLISQHSPSASYLRAIDVWMMGCFLFVFGAIVDCLVDIRLLFVVSQSYKQQNKPSFLLPVSVALVENRRVFDDLFHGDGDDGDDGDGFGDGVPDVTPSIYCDASEPGPSLSSLSMRSDATVKPRVSFAVAAALAPGGQSLVSPQPRHVKSTALELPAEPPSSQRAAALSQDLEQRALKFEKLSIIAYPALFALFNMCYWGYYLHASQPPPGLAEQISAGFTPQHSTADLPPGQ